MCIKNYQVILSDFAKKHYLFKKYSKKKNNKEVFLKAEKSLHLLLEKIELYLEKENANEITSKNENLVICKIEWKILPKETPKSSGNRCIISQNKEKGEVVILFAYHKNDCKGKETVWWKKKVVENFPEYKNIVGKI